MRRELLRLGVATERPQTSRAPRRGLAEMLRELRGMRGDALQAALGKALGDPDLVIVPAAPDGAPVPAPGIAPIPAPIAPLVPTIPGADNSFSRFALPHDGQAAFRSVVTNSSNGRSHSRH